MTRCLPLEFCKFLLNILHRMHQLRALLDTPLALHLDYPESYSPLHRGAHMRQDATSHKDLRLAKDIRATATLPQEIRQELLALCPRADVLINFTPTQLQNPKLVEEICEFHAVRVAYAPHVQRRDHAAVPELVEDERAVDDLRHRVPIRLDAAHEAIVPFLQLLGDLLQAFLKLLTHGQLRSLLLSGKQAGDANLAGFREQSCEMLWQGVLGFGNEVAGCVHDLTSIVAHDEALRRLHGAVNFALPLPSLGVQETCHHLGLDCFEVVLTSQMPVQAGYEELVVALVEFGLASKQLDNAKRLCEQLDARHVRRASLKLAFDSIILVGLNLLLEHDLIE
mmetsp:Transcript_144626/g.360490  ORF Transcript_144626/g.360490 Transcript_144626/m.360490 type:complete len:338 (-) Transcript_144626:577-1590(-)